MVRMANGSGHTFHQSVFAAAYLVDTGGRDLARADTAFDGDTLLVTWDECAEPETFCPAEAPTVTTTTPPIPDETAAPDETTAPEEPAASQAPTVDVADRIESLLQGGADGCVAACIAMYRHKRAHPDDNTEWLGEAVHTAKRVCGC